MKAKLLKSSMLIAATAMVFGCNPEAEEVIQPDVLGRSDANPMMEGCETISFNTNKVIRGADGFVTAVMSDQATTPILVTANRKTAAFTFSPKNSANIFDSGQSGPLGNEVDDILTPHKDFGGWGVGDGGRKGKTYANDTALGNVLIVNRTDSPTPAYDSNNGGKLYFDFSGYGSVTMNSITVLDVDSYEQGGKVELRDITGKVLKTVNLAVSGNNGKQIVNLGGTPGVVKMVVTLGTSGQLVGSGAIDDITFNCAPKPPCETITFTRFNRGQDGFVNSVTSDQASTPILVSAFRRTATNVYSKVNAANIFNSAQPTSIGNQVTDILTPHQNFGGGGVGDGGAAGAYVNNTPLGNTLIVNRTADASKAYDNNLGGKIVFDFKAYGTVSLSSLTILDVDDYEAGTKVVLYDATSKVIKEVMMKVSGNNGKQMVDLGGTTGVARMEIILGPNGISPNGTFSGSGAIDNIMFNCVPSM
ncbi:hypothetical protein [Rufibacter latericius]|uniref:Uncharacterized protein n=1 Tax=Rufibacter latericius TaxID=2487040 RepID=A0A3M9MVK4_9BACT|nr:hypothetical protein [Rufibacter latericius]RNI29215.1 hypothetical protein EFB08_07280 [Rufibacter latericius]